MRRLQLSAVFDVPDGGPLRDILATRIDLGRARAWHTGLGHVLRLRGATSIRYAYRRQTCGPSSFAAVEIRFTPSAAISVERACAWPESLLAEEQLALDGALACGLLDGLAPFSESPYHVEGVTALCSAIEWDDVGSSQVAFYAAAWHAARQLRQEAEWELVRWAP
jgi:hypothetical protein